MPERAASILNPRPRAPPNLGGSTRVKGEAVRRRLRMPTRLRVGERPAGAERVEDVTGAAVLSRGRGERAGRMGRRGAVTAGFREEKPWVGDGGALDRKKLAGFTTASLLEPSGHLERLGERKMTGSTFSASRSSSKEVAFRLEGEAREEDNARDEVSPMFCSTSERAITHTILTVLETREVLEARGVDGSKGLPRRCHGGGHGGWIEFRGGGEVQLGDEDGDGAQDGAVLSRSR